MEVKKLRKICIAMLIVLLFLNGCTVQDKADTINQSKLGEVKTTEGNGEGNIKINQSNDMILDEMSLEEVNEFLEMNLSEIISTTGEKFSEDFDTLSIIESHMFFPYVFDKELGLTFVFRNKTDDYKPVCIIVSKDSNVQNFNVYGAKPGMNFSEIQKLLGNADINMTWIGNEENTVYEFCFQEGGVCYRFISYDEKGIDSVLYISLQNSK